MRGRTLHLSRDSGNCDVQFFLARRQCFLRVDQPRYLKLLTWKVNAVRRSGQQLVHMSWEEVVESTREKKGKRKKECRSENRTPVAGLGIENANHSATVTTGSLAGTQVSYLGLRQNHEKFCGLREKKSRPLAKKSCFFRVAQLTGGWWETKNKNSQSGFCSSLKNP